MTKRIERTDKDNVYLIGILSQGITDSLDSILPPGHNFTTYIAVSFRYDNISRGRCVSVTVVYTVEESLWVMASFLLDRV